MQSKKLYNPLHFASSIFMIIALLWLTVSIPFVYASQKAMYEKNANATASDEKDASNTSNTTEEKTCNGMSQVNEYLHETPQLTNTNEILSSHKACHECSVYTAFHGELLSPPPNFSLA